VVGVSMGGIAAWNLALRRWSRWSVAGSVNGAPSLWELFGPDGEVSTLLPNLLAIPLVVLHGTEDRQITPQLDRDAVGRLRALGHENLTHVEVASGEHSWESMSLVPSSSQFAALADSIGRAVRDPWPKSVEHRATKDEGERALWLSLSGVPPRATAWARACVVGPNYIEVAVENAAQVTLHLNERLVEPGQVQVSVNSVVRTVEFEPQMHTMVASYVATNQDVELMSQDTLEINVDAFSRNEVVDV
jgi:pimeloyl-ACP methyl ester carboxylesterase